MTEREVGNRKQTGDTEGRVIECDKGSEILQAWRGSRGDSEKVTEKGVKN